MSIVPQLGGISQVHTPYVYRCLAYATWSGHVETVAGWAQHTAHYSSDLSKRPADIKALHAVEPPKVEMTVRGQTRRHGTRHDE
jgi:uncharacterized membrane protein